MVGMSLVTTNEAGRVMRVGDLDILNPDHAIMPAPTEALLIERLRKDGFESVNRFLLERNRSLEAQANDPHRFGWEPKVWKLVDALIEWPWMTEEEKARGRRIRARLGFELPLREVLINGGIRGTKTDYISKRTVQLLLHKPKARAAAWQSTEAMSISEQQPRIFHYLPRELKTEVRSQVHYLVYKQHGGFSEGKFILPNASQMEFRNYKQDLSTIEGAEFDLAWTDELAPVELHEAIKGRVSTAGRFGLQCNTFTPIDGFTPLVAAYREGARMVLDQTGYMLPVDAAGVPDMDKAKRVVDLLEWAEKGPPPKTPECLKFRSVPRVEKCAEPGKGVVFFHTADNEIVPSIEGVAQRYPRNLLMRLYGVAEKSYSARFAFEDSVHIVKPTAVPEAGTNVMITDPASGRNWVMLWVRFSRENVYVYREWPTQKRPVRGEGTLGVWAEFDGKKPDGKKGPGQKSMGWGLRRYKEEIAQLEGWTDYKEAQCGTSSVDAWMESSGAKERISARLMDSRYASSPKLENDRPVTTLTQFEDIRLWFDTTSGADIEDGLVKIEDLLSFDKTRKVDITNLPRLFVSEDCPNLIHCLKTWTGHDGQSGATKDFIDCLRYALMAGMGDMTPVNGAAQETRRRSVY